VISPPVIITKPPTIDTSVPVTPVEEQIAPPVFKPTLPPALEDVDLPEPVPEEVP
jgi:hypothetical protein